MSVKIAELNKRITFIDESETINDNGFGVKQEVEICRCWAKVSNKSGTEIFKANADYSKTTTRFLIRYRKNITNKMKIKFNNNIYKIVYINNYNYSNEYLEIIAEVIE